MFKVSGTNVFSGDGTTTDFALGTNNGMPATHPVSSPTTSDIVVTKFVNGVPTILDVATYNLQFSGGNATLRIPSPNIPENGSKIVVCKWTKARITEAIRARAGWEASNNSIASYNYWQENDLNNNQVYVDVTTGTGFVEYTSGTEYTALTTGLRIVLMAQMENCNHSKIPIYGIFLVKITHSKRSRNHPCLKIDLDTLTYA